VLSPRNVDLVSNDRVFLLLNQTCRDLVSDENCHFRSDGFCLFESKTSLLTLGNQVDL